MAPPRLLRIYLEPVRLKMAREGTFGFVAQVQAAFEALGFRVDLVRGTDEERLKSVRRRGYALFEMKEPLTENTLSIRRAYYYPFWRIERTARRWAFEVAEKRFDPAEIDTDAAETWARSWGRILFKAAPENTTREGFIYVALQGQLLARRSFQSMSPAEMIAEVQGRAGDKRILLGLHPGETYSEAEMRALDRIAAQDPRITVQTGGMEEALRRCDSVVTQNSAAALSGFFFNKPAILFGESDFHHQMPRVSELGVGGAWEALTRKQPDYAAYLYWFIQKNAIKADSDEAGAEIIARCRALGWEI